MLTDTIASDRVTFEHSKAMCKDARGLETTNSDKQVGHRLKLDRAIREILSSEMVTCDPLRLSASANRPPAIVTVDSCI